MIETFMVATFGPNLWMAIAGILFWIIIIFLVTAGIITIAAVNDWVKDQEYINDCNRASKFLKEHE